MALYCLPARGQNANSGESKEISIEKKITTKRLKILPGRQFWFLSILSKNQFWLIAIHFRPCNPALLPHNTGFILFSGIFLSSVFVYLVAFGNIMCQLENSNFYNHPWQCPFKICQPLGMISFGLSWATFPCYCPICCKTGPFLKCMRHIPSNYGTVLQLCQLHVYFDQLFPFSSALFLSLFLLSQVPFSSW